MVLTPTAGLKKEVKMVKMLIDPLQGHQVSRIEDSVSGFLHVLIWFHCLELIMTVLFLNKQKMLISVTC